MGMKSEKKTSSFPEKNKLFSFPETGKKQVVFRKKTSYFPEEKNYIYYVYIKAFFLPTSGVRKRGFKDCPFFPTLLTDKAKFSQEVNGKKWKQNFLWR